MDVYGITYGANGVEYYYKLNPTRRWKLKSGPYQNNDLYVEHKGIIFKSWVHENNIRFFPKEKEIIFECSKWRGGK